MCGANGSSSLKTVLIEGAEMQVCPNCAKYGKEVQGKAQSKSHSAPGKVIGMGNVHTSQASSSRPSRDMFDQMGGEIVDDYAERVRTARMKRGLSQKELAMELKIKELLVKKIEKGELVPEDETRKKLESELRISLLDSEGQDVQDYTKSRMETTMGDLISIRKVKKS
jgi:putative transcription factor